MERCKCTHIYIARKINFSLEKIIQPN
uniref:Uncharacterized protein n=1 Tax=Arundo donax TaxID=35708 RepID=A0A0A8Y9L6_ARUDO